MSSRLRLVLGIFAISLLGLVRPADAERCRTNADDQTAVVNTLRTLYAAATVDDFARLHAVVAPGFYGFDGGHEYSSIDSLMVPVKSQQDKGIQYIWNVTRQRVTVLCNHAWITYINEGSRQMPGAAPVPAQWLESAVLEKASGTWKIVFFQSTPVPPAKPAQ